jgi:hypothetical protein
MTQEQLIVEISLLINRTLYEEESITYQEYLQAEEILLDKLQTIS